MCGAWALFFLLACVSVCRAVAGFCVFFLLFFVSSCAIICLRFGVVALSFFFLFLGGVSWFLLFLSSFAVLSWACLPSVLLLARRFALVLSLGRLARLRVRSRAGASVLLSLRALRRVLLLVVGRLGLVLVVSFVPLVRFGWFLFLSRLVLLLLCSVGLVVLLPLGGVRDSRLGCFCWLSGVACGLRFARGACFLPRGCVGFRRFGRLLRWRGFGGAFVRSVLGCAVLCRFRLLRFWRVFVVGGFAGVALAFSWWCRFVACWWFAFRSVACASCFSHSCCRGFCFRCGVRVFLFAVVAWLVACCFCCGFAWLACLCVRLRF